VPTDTFSISVDSDSDPDSGFSSTIELSPPKDALAATDESSNRLASAARVLACFNCFERFDADIFDGFARFLVYYFNGFLL
jgi:hypothetical protein